ncbi:hypothetical protein [Winogradskyella pulchriflava]|uniref:Lipoprotein n=1 Tax=Winogradskyella pulchriflava TaxID=1110688 RepID=A0ABV6Q7N4_9FLAO
MKNLLSVPILIFLILVTFGCSSDSSSDDVDSEPGVANLSALINGNLLSLQNSTESDAQSVTGGYYVSNNIFTFSIASGGTFNYGIEGVAFSVGGEDFSIIEDGFEMTLTNNSGLSFYGGYSLIVDGEETAIGPFTTQSAYLKINSINKNTKIVSGEFAFTLVNNQTNEQYVISNGVFNNVEYTTE